MPKADWKSRNILSDIEHLEVFEKLFKATETELLRGACRTPWGNPARRLSLVDAYAQYIDEFKNIKSRRDMVGETGPILMVKAVYQALCDHFREPTYGHDTGREPTDQLAAELLRINSRALIILNFTKTLMECVTFHYLRSDVLDEEPKLIAEELINAVRNFDNDPDGALDFLESRVLRDLMR